MFLVEQNAFHALKLAHRGYVMVNGLITLSGTGQRSCWSAHGECKAAYLEGGRQLAAEASELRDMHRCAYISIPHLLYEEDSFGVFLLVTVVLGGGAAWLSGRAIAATWRPWWQVPLYMLILGAAVRFFHFALFDGPFAVAALLRGRYRCLPVVRLSGLPDDAGAPDGHPVRLAQSRRRGAVRLDAAA